MKLIVTKLSTTFYLLPPPLDLSTESTFLPLAMDPVLHTHQNTKHSWCCPFKPLQMPCFDVIHDDKRLQPQWPRAVSQFNSLVALPMAFSISPLRCRKLLRGKLHTKTGTWVTTLPSNSSCPNFLGIFIFVLVVTSRSMILLNPTSSKQHNYTIIVG